jgi:predicted RNase H-like HicB family nuclease
MTTDNYDFDGFSINLFLDDEGDWIAHFVEMPNISAFANNPKAALDELKIAWELVKEDYLASGEDIPVSPAKKEYSVSINS